MEQKDPKHLLIKIANILQKLKIPYFVTGGIAVLIWGRPRFTADIDIVIELKLKDIHSLVSALSMLGKANYIDKNMIKDALKHGGEFNFIHGETGIKVDFWVLRKQPFELSRIKRRVAKYILDQKVYFISPEDLILSKLQWYQQTQSTRHLEDIESILKISKVDLKYVKRWAAKQNTIKILKKIYKNNA